MRRTFVMCTVIVALGLLSARATADAELDALIANLQSHYDRLQTLSATFEQSYESARFAAPQTMRGELKIKKPGKMRWDYSKPKGKLLLSDGETITMYDPEDRQALVTQQPKDRDLPAAITFLSGSGRFKENFSFAWIQKPDAGKAILKVVPKKSEPNLKEMEWKIDVKEKLITATTIVDELEGKNTIAFSRIRTNPPLKDQDFKAKLPKQTTIVQQ